MWLISGRKRFCVERDQTSLPSPFPRREIRLWVWEGQFQWRVQWPGQIACRLLRVGRSRTGEEEEEEEWGGVSLKVTWPLFREQKRCNDADVNSTQLMSTAALFTFTDPRWIASRLCSFFKQLMSQLIYVCVPTSTLAYKIMTLQITDVLLFYCFKLCDL